MAIDLTYEMNYYAAQTERNARITAALKRDDVQRALNRAPDANGLSAGATDSVVTITTYSNIGPDPAIADFAELCDGEFYVYEGKQTLLEVPGVRVDVHLSGRWKLTEEERETLRAIGKLQHEVITREYLACAA